MDDDIAKILHGDRCLLDQKAEECPSPTADSSSASASYTDDKKDVTLQIPLVLLLKYLGALFKQYNLNDLVIPLYDDAGLNKKPACIFFQLEPVNSEVFAKQKTLYNRDLPKYDSGCLVKFSMTVDVITDANMRTWSCAYEKIEKAAASLQLSEAGLGPGNQASLRHQLAQSSSSSSSK